jgi:hypothetical protein
MELFVTNHAAKMYAAANSNDAVEYRAHRSEPWAICSSICAWNPAPFEYRKVAQRWIIDAETAFGPVIRRTFTHENDWVEALEEYIGHKIIAHSGRHAIVHRMKTAKWKDVPRMTRVADRSSNHVYELVAAYSTGLRVLGEELTRTLPLSYAMLAPDQPKMVVPYDQPGFLERLHDAGFRVLNDKYTFRILGLCEGWGMEQ